VLLLWFLGPVPEAQPSAPPKTQLPPKTQKPPKQEKVKKKSAKVKPKKPGKPANLWMEGKSDEGHTYYYNTETGGEQS